MKRKLLATVLCFALTAAVFAGCSDTDSSSVESVSDEQTEEFSYPLTLTDAYGNEVTVEAEPETVVSVSPALTEIIYAVGGEDKLIGRSDYCDYPDAVFDIQSVGVRSVFMKNGRAVAFDTVNIADAGITFHGGSTNSQIIGTRAGDYDDMIITYTTVSNHSMAEDL